jgi:hypothetical protein
MFREDGIQKCTVLVFVSSPDEAGAGKKEREVNVVSLLVEWRAISLMAFAYATAYDDAT